MGRICPLTDAPSARVPERVNRRVLHRSTGFIDDAAVFPPGNARARRGRRRTPAYRDAWYADLVGPFLVRDAASARAARAPRDQPPLGVSLIGDAGVAGALDGC